MLKPTAHTCRPQVQAEGHSPFREEELFRVTKELPETYQSRESAPAWLKIQLPSHSCYSQSRGCTWNMHLQKLRRAEISLSWGMLAAGHQLVLAKWKVAWEAAHQVRRNLETQAALWNRNGVPGNLGNYPRLPDTVLS